MPVSDKPLVLCMDDGADTRELLAQQLRQDGFDVVVARDGREGLRTAILYRPDVIVLDLTLPRVDGVRIATLIRSVRPLRDQPLVGLTGVPTALQDKALHAGCDLVLQKPAPQLSGKLWELLRRKRQPASEASSEDLA